ncbi:alpha/beta fold hydrolase [Pseudomonas oligotrophica]|uniref:alpha/beta fold hydrolase n=1 Tax=Pseudomonas oligotrophica TaxID=2912055 RepID=UPI001F294420|nr:alpha/beta hydrolase [Pseudomonas oligotrophica]MCF7203255.1 alpha/beta hydrolase [Pseudomonas oligotrophica]
MTRIATLDHAPSDLWVRSAGGRIGVRRWLPGPAANTERAPIILLHESLGCIEQWRDFPARLCQATGRTVVAYDRPGFGRSEQLSAAPAASFIEDEADQAFAAVREQLGIDAFVVLGHSVGGSMAVHCAARFAGACRALITLSAVTFVEPRTLEGIRQAKAWFADASQRERLRRFHGERSDWVLSAWIDTWLDPRFAAWSVAAALPAVRCPALVFHGCDDEFGSERHPQLIERHAGGPVEQALLPGVGHVPHREQPAEVLARIATFLATIA